MTGLNGSRSEAHASATSASAAFIRDRLSALIMPVVLEQMAPKKKFDDAGRKEAGATS